jgi:sugar/nucleoside kinase (ribokinase family)
VVGVGSALIDILVHETDDFLLRVGAEKGGMTLVEMEGIEDLLAKVKTSPTIVTGGSACNTVVGIGKLGGHARFVGKCGKGPMGRLLENDLKKNAVDPYLFKSSSPTGRVLSLITPDAQRSMFTYLGASAETAPEEMAGGCFDQAAIVHIEGYLLFNPELIFSVLRSAKEAGALISLDLASFTVVEASRDILKTIIADFVDILIANEDEAHAYTGHSDDAEAISALSENVLVAVLKLGEKGSLIDYNGHRIRVAPKTEQPALDTTGAGDLWAAGFLFGLVNGFSIEKAGALGSACGYEVCRVIGATIPDDGWVRIKCLLDNLDNH